jgi:hypothetical protein
MTSALQKKLELLEQRLNRGADIVQAAKDEDLPYEKKEQFWIDLLEEYKETFAELHGWPLDNLP